MKKITQIQSANATLSAFCGIGCGVIAIIFAIALAISSYQWLAAGATCYGLAMMWLGWMAWSAVKRGDVEE